MMMININKRINIYQTRIYWQLRHKGLCRA